MGSIALPSEDFVPTEPRIAQFAVPELEVPKASSSTESIEQTPSTINSHLLWNGDYSDAVIKVGDTSFDVHRAFLCPQSAFFKAAFDGGFKVRDFHLFKVYHLVLTIVPGIEGERSLSSRRRCLCCGAHATVLLYGRIHKRVLGGRRF